MVYIMHHGIQRGDKMKLVTNDYGCGTSSSILDYQVEDVIIVSESNYEHIFDTNDDLLFIGHDFLFYLWDSEEKLKKWLERSKKHEHWLWCFERIDAIIPAWQQKSHLSLSIASQFCKRIFACDEDDCDKYKFEWLPQWASKKFYDLRKVNNQTDKVLFSGQAGIPEYQMRNELLSKILSDNEIKDKIEVTNTKRIFTWDSYIQNFLRHKTILNPVGILRGLNTRAYEAIYSGRVLLQHTIGTYSRHEKMLENNEGVVFFRDYQDLKKNIDNISEKITNPEKYFHEHSLHARMKMIGIEIK